MSSFAENNYVLVVGGINIDIKAKSFDKLKLKDSNPGSISFASGGVARNIAHNLALLDMPVKLLSVVGGDDDGKRVLRDTSAAGVDVKDVLILESHRTGTYIALLDKDGEMEAAISSMEIFDYISPEFLETKLDLITKASSIVCDTNIPLDSIKYLIKTANQHNIPICLEPVSTAKARKLKESLKGVTIITPNLEELKELSDMDISGYMLEEAANAVVEKGVKYVVTTLGEKGICVIGENFSLSLKSYKTNVVDVTGAGDSLTAGLIFGMMNFQSIEASCRCGLAAASITVASKDTVSNEMSKAKVLEIIKG